MQIGKVINWPLFGLLATILMGDLAPATQVEPIASTSGGKEAATKKAGRAGKKGPARKGKKTSSA